MTYKLATQLTGLNKTIQVHNPKLPETQNALLKPISEKDVDQNYVDGLNDPEVAKWLLSLSGHETSAEEIKAYVKENLHDPNSILFGFFIDDILCGTLRLHNAINARVDLGVAIFSRKSGVNLGGQASLKVYVKRFLNIQI